MSHIKQDCGCETQHNSDIDPRKLALWTYQQWREDGGTPEIIAKMAKELDYLAQEELAEKKEVF